MQGQQPSKSTDDDMPVDELTPAASGSDSAWGDFPPLTGADREAAQTMQRLREEEDAKKTRAERRAEAAAREAQRASDAAKVAAVTGMAQRPGGEWMTEDEHRAYAGRLRRRALRGFQVAERDHQVRAAVTRAQPRRRESRPRTLRPRAALARAPDSPGRGQDDPDLANVEWTGLLVASARMMVRLRRRSARAAA